MKLRSVLTNVKEKTILQEGLLLIRLVHDSHDSEVSLVIPTPGDKPFVVLVGMINYCCLGEPLGEMLTCWQGLEYHE